MGKLNFLFIFTLSFLSFASLSTAQVIMTTSSNGTQQVSFMTNETMYIVANNITNASATVNVYLRNHNASIANLTVLNSGQVLGPVSITTNSSGGFDVRSFWTPVLIAGTYDLIADVNNNNLFDIGSCGNGGDCNYSGGGGGISVIRAPIPTLGFSVGSQSPPSHTYSYDANIRNNVMLQIRITGDQAEPIQITSLDFIPSGAGDDRNGITIVKVFDDSNSNGVVDQGEPLLGYGQFLSDDGVLRLDLSSSPYKIQTNTTVNLLVQYTMSSQISSGQTFTVQLVSITAAGVNTLSKAVVNGLPVTSATKTIIGGGTTSSTSSTTTTTTTTTTLDQCSKDSDCGSSTCSNGTQTSPACKTDSQKGYKVCNSTTTKIGCCPGEKCGGFDFNNVYLLLIVAVIAFLVPSIYFFFIRKPKQQQELYKV